MSFGMWSIIRWGAHWRNLANTIEPSMCGGDAAFLSNYFDHLLRLQAHTAETGRLFDGGVKVAGDLLNGATSIRRSSQLLQPHVSQSSGRRRRVDDTRRARHTAEQRTTCDQHSRRQTSDVAALNFDISQCQVVSINST